MNKVSIIINGKRYDAVQVEECAGYDSICEECDLLEECSDDNYFRFCASHLEKNYVFKESDKKFEP